MINTLLSKKGTLNEPQMNQTECYIFRIKPNGT